MTSAPIDEYTPPDLDRYTRLIAAEVRAEMARQNITQTAIARNVLGTYPSKAQPRFKGLIPFTAAELLAIADYLDTDVVQFLAAAKGNRPTPFGGVIGSQRYEESYMSLIAGTAEITSPRTGQLALVGAA